MSQDSNALLVDLSSKFFRKGSKCRTRACNFLIVQGGMGDFIGYMAAILYIAENHPQIHGRVYCFSWFMPIAENLLSKFPTWRVKDYKELTKKHLTTRPTFAPSQHPIERFGASAVDLGYIYYLGITPPPEEGNFYPELDLSVLDGLEAPAKEYAVMTPVSSTKPRTLLPETFNGIKNHLLEKDIVPVFIGSLNFSETRKVSVCDDYDLSGGVNLVNKTSLLEAAAIMAKARFVVGLDNGLLHLAAMTPVPIIFGYTVASPLTTQPRRRQGTIHNIHCDPETLSCLFCQNRMRMMGNYDFKDCYYKDELCLKAISDPKDWNNAIDEILECRS